MRIAILGAGNVGGALGKGLARAGHAVSYAVRDATSTKHESLRASGSVRPVREAVADAEVVILATPWGATEAALAEAGDLAGKVLVDATNPIGPGLRLTHGHTDSGAEQVARWAKGARVVKCFNTTGFENMADPAYPGGARAAMFACGDDAEARSLVLELARQLGFAAVDAGGLAQARVLEPTALLWIQLALVLGNGRNVALGLLTREEA